MLFLAISALEKAKHVPGQVWVKIALGILAFIAFVQLLRKLAGVNKIMLSIVCFVLGGLLFFTMVYNRSEPAFLTPMVDKIAPFFPSKSDLTAKPAPAKPAPKPAPVPDNS